MPKRCPALLRVTCGEQVQLGLGGQGVGKCGEGEGSPVRGTSMSKRVEGGQWLPGCGVIRRSRAHMKPCQEPLMSGGRSR